jgi:hypothetical protein
MYKLLTLLFGLSFYAVAFSQAIDYNPKQLTNDIQKLHGLKSMSDFSVRELSLQGIPDRVEGRFFKMTVGTCDNIVNYVYIGRVNSCRAGGCSDNRILLTGDISEYFDYYIIFGDDCKIKQVRIYNYQATHGQEVTNKGWLKQFIDFDGKKKLKVGKNVDAISGATISVYAITADIENKTLLLRNLLTGNEDKFTEVSALSGK